MKKTFLLIALFIFTLTVSKAQDSCSKYYPLEEGVSFQYTMYDKKGKTDGKTDYKIIGIANSGEGTEATMHMSFTDKKGKEVFESDYNFTCTGNGIKIDYNSIMPQKMLDQFGDMEYEITGTDIEIPNDLSAGQNLDDANVNMAINMAGMNMKIEVNMINRKVEKEEKVTTPAGNFTCYVIYSDTESKTMGTTHTFPSRQWLAEGVGMVKQETYKGNGDLMSSMQLTKYSK